MENITDTEIIDQKQFLKERKPYKVALKYGLLLALVSIILDMAVFVITGEPTKYSQGGWAMLQSLILFGVTIVLAGKEHSEKDLNGFLPYNRILRLGALIGLFGGIISSLYVIVKMTFLYDPNIDLELRIMEEMEKSASTMSEEEYEMAKQMALKFSKIFISPVVVFIIGIISSVFWSFILSLLVGLGIKKNFSE